MKLASFHSQMLNFNMYTIEYLLLSICILTFDPGLFLMTSFIFKMKYLYIYPLLFCLFSLPELVVNPVLSCDLIS